MGYDNKICESALIDRFFDAEVSREERARVEAHVADCPECRRRLEANREIGALLLESPEHRLSGKEKTALENRLIERMRNDRWWKRTAGDGWLRPRRLVSLAAAVGVLLLAFTFFSKPDIPAGPSAIVTSFQGEYTSVMIVETPETRNTIIWFDETT